MGRSQVVSLQELLTRVEAIFDGLEAGEGYTVTRHGREVAELIPIRRKRTFVSRETFIAMGQVNPGVDADRAILDIRGAFSDDLGDPYDR